MQTEAVYQTMNGSLAWMAVKELQKQDLELQQTEDGVFLEGMAHMHWPGRLEELLPGGLCGWRTQCRRHQEAP